MLNRLRFHRAMVLAGWLGAALLLPHGLFAQQQDPPPDAATIRAILERMKARDSRVKTQRARVQLLKKREKAKSAAQHPGETPVAAATIPRDPAPGGAAPAMIHPGEGTTGPQLHLRGYGDIG